MRLERIALLKGTIELLTGLHIGGGNVEMHIGGTDNPVVKRPDTGEPYIPGSSLKGRMRSLMEWKAGVVAQANGHPLGLSHVVSLQGDTRKKGVEILKLFGYPPLSERETREEHKRLIQEIGPRRLAFWDCPPDPDWVKEMRDRNLLLTEIKTENMIDRIRGVAQHPRTTERVPAGARFKFKLTVNFFGEEEEEILGAVYRGLKLVQLAGLGGSISRGYGRVQFKDLKLDGKDVQEDFEQCAP